MRVANLATGAGAARVNICDQMRTAERQFFTREWLSTPRFKKTLVLRFWRGFNISVGLSIVLRDHFASVMRAQLSLFSAAFIALLLAYTIGFLATVSNSADASEDRFVALMALNAPGRAAGHGERALKLREKRGDTPDDMAPLRAAVSRAQLARGKHRRAAVLLEQAMSASWASRLSATERASMEELLARTQIAAGEIDKAIFLYTEFLDRAGDEGAREENEETGTPEAFYAQRIEDAADLFAETLKPTGSPERFKGSPEARLAVAEEAAELGAFFAMRPTGRYAAAGLLSSAYEIRRLLLGGDHREVVQIALILGPVYTEMGRLTDAERIYLDAFHAQEKVKGSNNPDLSLYLKLLADIYRRQGRVTEAQAFYDYMNGLFKDAFGEQRYATNRRRDRRYDADRPVSQYFILASDYYPTDLVRASDYAIPVSKNHQLDEMKLRLAVDPGGDPKKASMPGRLSTLINRCRRETGERLSLRSGFRSYETQRILYERNGSRGLTAPPGMSEHQLGLAADIDVNGRLMRRSDRTYQCFEESAFEYGFILSYPPGNDYLPGADPFEPWHWRYVGVETARLYREAGPIDKPQEFLAALPCYRERAAAGVFLPIGERDMCLEDVTRDIAERRGDKVDRVAEAPKRPAPPTSPLRRPARKLNNDLQQ
ncbi:MAG: D-alanyl-D-alanine carboxypeptidase family protein [Pseudomonadota bacterium]